MSSCSLIFSRHGVSIPLLACERADMQAMMTKRPRLNIDAPDDVRLAMKLVSARTDKSISELVLELIQREYAAEIRDARKYLPKKKHDDE